MQNTYELVREAIQTRKTVIGLYRGHWVTFCPHVLGWSQDEAYVVAYRLFPDATARKRAAGPPGYWDRIRLAELHWVRAYAGPWLPGPSAALAKAIKSG
jgi:hypothetical protein